MTYRPFFHVLPVFIGLATACQSTYQAPPRTGIEFQLSSADPNDPLYPEGSFHVQGLDRRLSVHVPLEVPESELSAQRLQLPAGSYSVSYLPIATEQGLLASRRSPVAKVWPENPFLVVVSEGRFTTVKVRAIDALAGSPSTQAARPSSVVH